VQLINKDDGVLALHQFLHDGLEPLFELSAVFGSGDNQRKVQRENALIGEEWWNIAIGDTLREPFNDGGLADAGLSDKHRIVLGAPAKNLNDPIDFAFTPNQWIERAFGSCECEIAAELRKQRGFFGTRRGRLFA